jgi:hypothetical protein
VIRRERQEMRGGPPRATAARLVVTIKSFKLYAGAHINAGGGGGGFGGTPTQSADGKAARSSSSPDD